MKTQGHQVKIGTTAMISESVLIVMPENNKIAVLS